MQFFTNIHDDAQLVALPQCSQEVILNLIDIKNADDFELLSAVPNAKNKVPPFRIREGRNRFIGASGHVTLRLLELNISPFMSVEQLYQFILSHDFIPARCVPCRVLCPW